MLQSPVVVKAKRLLKLLLGAYLMLSLVVPIAEVLENIEHLFHDGHLAHSVEHDEVGAAESHADLDEHGCTPMQHNCECHISAPGIVPRAEDAVRLDHVVVSAWLWQEGWVPDRSRAPPTRPPIA